MASPYAPAAPPGAMFGTAAFHAPGYVNPAAPTAPPQDVPGFSKRKHRREMIIVSSVLLALGVLILIFCVSAESEYQKATKGTVGCLKSVDDRVVKGTCMIDKCSRNRTPQGLVGTSAMLLVVIVLMGTVYGQCPCCCKSKLYAKDKIFYLAVIFLLLLWIHFVLNFVYTVSITATLTFRTTDELCIRVAKGRIAGVGILGLLVGLFAAGHTLTVGIARGKGLARENAIPIALPVAM